MAKRTPFCKKVLFSKVVGQDVFRLRVVGWIFVDHMWQTGMRPDPQGRKGVYAIEYEGVSLTKLRQDDGSETPWETLQGKWEQWVSYNPDIEICSECGSTIPLDDFPKEGCVHCTRDNTWCSSGTY